MINLNLRMDIDNASMQLIGRQQQKIYELQNNIEKKSKLLQIIYQDNINKLSQYEKTDVKSHVFIKSKFF